ncbi:hypothetical protein CASFOL_012985 [Castilleja foliolosa]|uniref:S-protein homolog n=1 Tax=Castilleja foliolosa TaxID=1961234 RepID=A0ABD3DIP1_9LAMI
MEKYLLQMFIFYTIIFQTMSLSEAARWCLFSRRVTVHIVNQLPANTSPLFLRCQSKDNDLGKHALYYQPNEFTFSFCSGFTTLFFCHLRWNEKDISFDVFNSVGDCAKDNTCYYEARSDGIYFSQYYPPKDFTKVRDW